jgi:hypothetical protein
MVGLLPAVLMLFSGLGALPTNLPPGPMDPRLPALAPQECLVWCHWAPLAAADKNSPNHTERLLAEPEIQQLVGTVEKALLGTLRRQRLGEQEKVMLEHLPVLLRTALTHAACICVSTFNVGLEGAQVEGAIVVNAANNAAAVQKALQAIEPLILKNMGGAQPKEIKVGQATLRALPVPPGFPQVAWGMVDNYAVIAVGQATAQQVVQKLAEKAQVAPPAWLAEITKSAPVPRVASVTYLNARGIAALAGALGGPEMRRTLAALGMNSVKSLANVSGLDQQAAVNKMLLEIDGPMGGLLALMRGRALKLEDVAAAGDSSLAATFSLDPAELWREMMGIIQSIDENARRNFDREMEQVRQELGLDIERDLLATLGDSWSIYNSPAQGGLIITGLTAVAKVKDARKAAESHEKLLAKIKQEMPQGERRRGVFLKDMEFEGRRIYYLNPVGQEMPMSFCWSLGEDELVVAFYPQMIKSYLAGKKQPRHLPPAMKALWDGRQPVMAMYVDTPELFRVLYPLAHPLLTLGLGELQREVQGLDISILPRAQSIAPHLVPSTCAVYRTETGLLIESKGTLTGGTGIAPLLIPAAAFGVSASGSAAPAPMPSVMVEPAPN